MPPILLFLLGFGVVVFFVAIAILYLKIEKDLRNLYIVTEIKVKKFLENG